MPVFDAAERHEILIDTPPERIYAALRTLDVQNRWIVRLLFQMRGLAKDSLTMEGLLRSGFILLGEQPNREIVLGLVGKFWTGTACLQQIRPDEFCSFHEPGYAKAAWNFSLIPLEKGMVRLTTETRVLCTDGRSRLFFRMYWMCIKPFSGWIRREILKSVKGHAELTPSP